MENNKYFNEFRDALKHFRDEGYTREDVISIIAIASALDAVDQEMDIFSLGDILGEIFPKGD